MGVYILFAIFGGIKHAETVLHPSYFMKFLEIKKTDVNSSLDIGFERHTKYNILYS